MLATGSFLSFHCFRHNASRGCRLYQRHVLISSFPQGTDFDQADVFPDSDPSANSGAAGSTSSVPGVDTGTPPLNAHEPSRENATILELERPSP